MYTVEVDLYFVIVIGNGLASYHSRISLRFVQTELLFFLPEESTIV